MENAARRVLVVEDDASLRGLMRATLIDAGYDVTEASDGVQALGQVAWREPCVILLDLGLPDLDGLSVLGRLRERSSVPIIVISGRSAENDTIAALDRGANHYMTKPISMAELLARIRASLRGNARLGESATSVLSVGKLHLDLTGHVVHVGDDPIQLSKTEYDFLQVLARHSGRVVTHRNLLTQVWGPAFVHHVEYLRVIVRRLRTKLEPVPSEPRFLLTVAGVGYRLQP